MKYFTIILLSFLLLSCGSDNDPQSSSEEWLLDVDLVFDGGPGKDGIPSVDAPNFTKASDVDYLDPQTLVLGIRVGNTLRAYPHAVLDWHEIVNDEIENEDIALTYCPLTGTGIGWDRNINGTKTTFGVSGLLYNSNLMPYDRASNSTWSQLELQCVNGANINQEPQLHSFIETRWDTWLAAFPNSEVLNEDTGFSRNYGDYPYGDFRTNHDYLIFPITNDDNRLPRKERVLGVIENQQKKVFTFDSISSELDLVQTEFNNGNVSVISHRQKNFIVAFIDNDLELKLLEESSYPLIVEDADGIQYDILGHSPNGDSLERPDQFIGYWFSFGAFDEDVILIER